METNSNEIKFKDIVPFAAHERTGNFYDAEYITEINQEQLYSAFPGYKDTANNIDEVGNNEEGLHVEKKYCMETWYDFDDAILFAAKDFYDENDVLPNMIVFNNFTHDQICWLTSISPKRKFITDDDNEEKIEISIFEYSDCTLQVATTPDTEDLKNMEFYMVYDEDNGEDDDDDEERDLPIGGPNETVEIMKSY